MKGHFNNILIVRADRMGDVVLTTPVVCALRRAFPEARLTMLVSPAIRELVQGLPGLDDVMCDDRAGRHRWLSGFARLVFELRQKKFDLVFNFHTKRRTNLLCFLAGIPLRVGYRNDKWGHFLTDPVADDRRRGLTHESEYCLKVLRYFGIPAESSFPKVAILPSAEKWVEDFLDKNHLNSRGLIAVHPSASDPAKRWPIGFYVDIIRHLREKDPLSSIVVIGSRVNQADADVMRPFWGEKIIDMTGKTTVGQMASLLKRCRMLISNDSGPVHVASALGIGVVSIFTRNQPGINPERWRPLGPKSRFIAPEADATIACEKEGAPDKSFLEQCPRQDILRIIDEVYNLC